MENREHKNEALIGGSGLNAELGESAELQCSHDNSKNLNHPCANVDPDMRYWCENCLTKALESNAVLLARRKRASPNV